MASSCFAFIRGTSSPPQTSATDGKDPKKTNNAFHPFYIASGADVIVPMFSENKKAFSPPSPVGMKAQKLLWATPQPRRKKSISIEVCKSVVKSRTGSSSELPPFVSASSKHGTSPLAQPTSIKFTRALTWWDEQQLSQEIPDLIPDKMPTNILVFRDSKKHSNLPLPSTKFGRAVLKSFSARVDEYVQYIMEKGRSSIASMRVGCVRHGEDEANSSVACDSASQALAVFEKKKVEGQDTPISYYIIVDIENPAGDFSESFRVIDKAQRMPAGKLDGEDEDFIVFAFATCVVRNGTEINRPQLQLLQKAANFASNGYPDEQANKEEELSSMEVVVEEDEAEEKEDIEEVNNQQEGEKEEERENQGEEEKEKEEEVEEEEEKLHTTVDEAEDTNADDDDGAAIVEELKCRTTEAEYKLHLQSMMMMMATPKFSAHQEDEVLKDRIEVLSQRLARETRHRREIVRKLKAAEASNTEFRKQVSMIPKLKEDISRLQAEAKETSSAHLEDMRRLEERKNEQIELMTNTLADVQSMYKEKLQNANADSSKLDAAMEGHRHQLKKMENKHALEVRELKRARKEKFSQLKTSLDAQTTKYKTKLGELQGRVKEQMASLHLREIEAQRKLASVSQLEAELASSKRMIAKLRQRVEDNNNARTVARETPVRAEKDKAVSDGILKVLESCEKMNKRMEADELKMDALVSSVDEDEKNMDERLDSIVASLTTTSMPPPRQLQPLPDDNNDEVVDCGSEKKVTKRINKKKKKKSNREMKDAEKQPSSKSTKERSSSSSSSSSDDVTDTTAHKKRRRPKPMTKRGAGEEGSGSDASSITAEEDPKEKEEETTVLASKRTRRSTRSTKSLNEEKMFEELEKRGRGGRRARIKMNNKKQQQQQQQQQQKSDAESEVTREDGHMNGDGSKKLETAFAAFAEFSPIVGQSSKSRMTSGSGDDENRQHRKKRNAGSKNKKKKAAAVSGERKVVASGGDITAETKENNNSQQKQKENPHPRKRKKAALVERRPNINVQQEGDEGTKTTVDEATEKPKKTRKLFNASDFAFNFISKAHAKQQQQQQTEENTSRRKRKESSSEAARAAKDKKRSVDFFKKVLFNARKFKPPRLRR